MDELNKNTPPAEDAPVPADETSAGMPQLILDSVSMEAPIPHESIEAFVLDDLDALEMPIRETPSESPVILAEAAASTSEPACEEPAVPCPEGVESVSAADPVILMSVMEPPAAEPSSAPEYVDEVAVIPEDIPARDVPESPEVTAVPPAEASSQVPQRPPVKKGRPKRKKGYGFFGIPHLLATLVWLAIIVAIGTSLGRMLWVCAADVLAFGRESKKVSITITSNDTIEDIAEKLHDAELVRYPELFKLYAKLAVDDGDILPGTFEMDTLYDYHALVVQMGPRSSNRSVIEDVLIPEGLNCRQIFELLEQQNICTVAELEEYAANGDFGDYWFLEGVERGDRYCLEGFLFPDTYDFYIYSTPREALGKMLNGFEYRFTQEVYDQLPALNERLSAMMRAKGCSEEYIAENQLDLRDLLTVASLIEEETASAKESPMIASVIFNRLTEDQMYERYLNIDAAIIYATGSSSNIDTSIDHPYNTYKHAGLTPGPISNPGLESIHAALNFEDSQYYYYVLNPETGMHQFSKTLEEHEKWVEEFRNSDGGDEG